MGQFNPKTFPEILERMINRVVSRTDLTDLNDGSSLKQVLAAAAREDDDAYFQMINLLDLFDMAKASGADLDERAKELNPALISRRQAAPATGQVVFSRSGTVGSVSIPIGTIVKVPASDGQQEILFRTTEAGSIAVGASSSGNVDVQATAPGANGNVAIGSIVGFGSRPSGVDSVANPAALTNGADLESDDSFRRRLKDQIAGLARAHVYGLQVAALSGEDPSTGKRVVFAQVVEDQINRGNVEVFVDDGAGTAESTTVVSGATALSSAIGGETFIFLPVQPIKIEEAFALYLNGGATPLVRGTDYTLNPASGQINFLSGPFPTGLSSGDSVQFDATYFTGLIAIVQKIIDGDPADRANYPGYRAAGVLVRVRAPMPVWQVVTADLTVYPGHDVTEAVGRAREAVSAYINSLGIGEDVVLNELRERLMGVPGVYDVSVRVPTENQVIQDGRIARIASNNISIA